MDTKYVGSDLVAMKSGLITAKMKEDGVYDNWRSIKHKISTEWKKKNDIFAADSKQLKALGQRAQPTRDKYKIYGYSVMLLHFISTFLYIYIYIYIISFCFAFTTQRAAYNQKSVQTFCVWKWCHRFTGFNNDWIGCKPACLHHNYTPGAKQALVALGYITSTAVLDGAKARIHYLCRILCNKHSSRTVATFVGTGCANIAQHINKKVYAPGLIQLFRFVPFYIPTYIY